MDKNIIGFISAPAWFDPAPSEFPRICLEPVKTQQAPMLLPEFDYKLESIAKTQEDLALCARSLKAMGCSLAAQVGSPFAWADAASEDEARQRCESMEKASGIPVVMTGLSIVDALKFLGVKKIAANCTYYDSAWRNAFGRFMEMCGFELAGLSNLSDQGLADPGISITDYGWSMTRDLSEKSILAAAQAAPEAEAVVVTGAGVRTFDLLSAMEKKIDRPIIAADTILYWAVAKKLGLTLNPEMGSWAE